LPAQTIAKGMSSHACKHLFFFFFLSRQKHHYSEKFVLVRTEQNVLLQTAYKMLKNNKNGQAFHFK